MSIKEILKVIEDSPRGYTIKGGASGTYTNDVWPVGDEPEPAFRVVKGPAGRRTVQPLKRLPKATERRLKAAEAAFKARKMADAATGYADVLKASPDHYPAQLFLGDALLFSDKATEALAAYERAAQLAPWSYVPWFFQASAMIRLARFDEAADRYARALSLRPSWPTIVNAIESNGRHIQKRVGPQLLKPTAHAFATKDGIVVEADHDHPAWLPHALCKAMWLGEPELRKKRTGKASHEFTMLEEGECLVVLLEAYESTREEQRDPALERVLQIAQDGYLTELILYELASRVAPMSIPTLEDHHLQRLHQFVSRYVLLSTGGPAGAERDVP